MEAPVGLFPGFHIGCTICLVCCRFGLVQQSGSQVLSGVPQCQDLQYGSHFGNFPEFCQVESGHPHSSARLADCKALSLKTPKGLSHRNVANAKF